jgi:hypothetical protein
MKKFIKNINGYLILLLLLNASGNILNAQNSIKVQNTAVPFLLIPPDSKSSGMGNTTIGMSGNINDIFQNASKLPTLKEKSGYTMNYTPWLKDLGLDNVYLLTTGFYRKINESSAFHLSLKYFTLGTINLTDEKGVPNMPSQKTGEFSFDAGYSLKLSNNLSLGATLKYINSRLIQGNFNGTEYKAGKTIAGDVSLFYQQNENAEGFHAGLLLSNLGGKMNYSSNTDKYFLPARLSIGAGYLKNIDDKNAIEFGIDAKRLLVPAIANDATQDIKDAYYGQSVFSSLTNSFSGNTGVGISESFTLSAGVEYNYSKFFYLRAGYHYEKNVIAGKTDYISTGASIKYNKMMFHLSYIPPLSYSVARNPLSNTFSFGTSIHF